MVSRFDNMMPPFHCKDRQKLRNDKITWLRHLSVIVVTSALSLTTAAEARQVLPIIGVHAGDHTVVAQCPHGQVMAGLSGRVGTWIDQVQLMCSTPIYGGSYSQPTPGSDRLGGAGGGASTQVCDSQSRLLAVKIDLTQDATRVGTIEMNCVAPDGRQTTMYFGSFGSSRSAAKCTGFTGCDPGEAERGMHQQSCPQEAFVGFTVRFGMDVNSIGFICDAMPLPLRVTGKRRVN